ncbi:hypothetical protein MTP99_000693 [Tenebrio molitor]|nr:hypothetical protein MTP99_000693 [Tenebrio molitor]
MKAGSRPEDSGLRTAPCPISQHPSKAPKTNVTISTRTTPCKLEETKQAVGAGLHRVAGGTRPVGWISDNVNGSGWFSVALKHSYRRRNFPTHLRRAPRGPGALPRGALLRL